MDVQPNYANASHRLSAEWAEPAEDILTLYVLTILLAILSEV